MNELIKWLLLFVVALTIVMIIFLKKRIGVWLESLFRKKEYVMSWRLI